MCKEMICLFFVFSSQFYLILFVSSQASSRSCILWPQRLPGGHTAGHRARGAGVWGKHQLPTSFPALLSMKIYTQTAAHYCYTSEPKVASVSPAQWPCQRPQVLIHHSYWWGTLPARRHWDVGQTGIELLVCSGRCTTATSLLISDMA